MAASAESQRIEKRRCLAAGAVVSGLSHHERRVPAGDCSQGTRTVQSADPGTDATNTGSQSVEGGRVSGSLPHRLAWLLRLLPIPPECSPSSTHISAADCGCTSGASGRPVATASGNCGVAVSPHSKLRSRQGHRPASGVCLATQRSNRPYATRTSTPLGFPVSPRLRTLNSIEPPWYVIRMPGGVTGTAREGLPMSIYDPQEPFAMRAISWVMSSRFRPYRVSAANPSICRHRPIPTTPGLARRVVLGPPNDETE